MLDEDGAHRWARYGQRAPGELDDLSSVFVDLPAESSCDAAPLIELPPPDGERLPFRRAGEYRLRWSRHPQQRKVSKLQRWVRGVAVIVVAGVGVVAAPKVTTEATPPPQWDPLIEPLARFVEQHHAAEFSAPVPVTFIDEEQMRSRRRLTADDRVRASERIHSDGERLRALGHLGDGIGYFLDPSAPDALPAGYYDTSERRIYVLKDKPFGELALTLVHELTHALQDDAQLIGDVPHGSLLKAAVVEGDAEQTEREFAYEHGLPYFGPSLWHDEVFVSSDHGGLEHGAEASAPYALGQAFLDVVEAARGREGVLAALETPPVTEEQLMDPWAYLREEAALKVSAPPVPADDPIRDTGTFGALSWYLLLAEHIDPAEALVAAEGWGGDSRVEFEHRGDRCLRLHFVGDTKADTQRMRLAIDGLVDSHPAAAISRVENGAGVTVCDPGESPRNRAISSIDSPLFLPYLRNMEAVDVQQWAGTSLDVGRCYAQTRLEELGALTLRAYDELDDDERARIDEWTPDEVLLACGASAVSDGTEEQGRGG